MTGPGPPALAAALRVASAAWLVFIGWGNGRGLLRLAGARGLSAPAEGALGAGLGLGALSLCVLGLGAAGALRPAALWTLLAAATASALLALRVRGAPGTAVAAVSPVPAAAGRAPGAGIPLLLAGAAGAVAAAAALAPPVFYDALVYHLGVPNRYLIRGRIEPLPHVVYSNFPLGAQMLYLLGLFLGGPEGAGLVGFAFAPLAAWALFALAQPLWGGRAAAAGAAFFLLTPQVFTLAHTLTVELPMTFYVLLTFLCLLRWDAGRDRGALLLAGVCGGLALSTKYLGGLVAVALPAALLAARRERWAALRLAGAAALTASPWLAKNLLFTGNPVHPALHRLFGGAGWSAALTAALDADAHAAWASASPWSDLLRLPLDVALGRGALGAASAGGWVFVPLAVAAAFVGARRPARGERLVLALLAGCALLWTATYHNARFLLPTLALGTALAAAALDRLGTGGRWPWQTLAAAALAAGTFATLAGDRAAALGLEYKLLCAAGLQEREAYLGMQLRIHPAVRYVNALPGAVRVLLVGDPKPAYLTRDHLYASALDGPLLPDLLGDARDSAGAAAALRRAGVTHVIVNRPEWERTEAHYPLSRTPDAVKSAFRACLDERCRLLGSANEVALYELRGPDAAP